MRFIDKKDQMLTAENELLVQKSCKIKANIKLVLDVSVKEQMKELNGLSILFHQNH